MSSNFESDVFCDYCGLPVPGANRRRRAKPLASAPEYCCSGCRFAASVLASDASDGPARHTLLKLGLGVFFAMNVMVFSMALWTSDVYGDQWLAGGPLAAAVHDVFRYLALVFCLPVLFLLGEPLAVGVWQAVRRGVVTTDLLLLVGVSSAVGYSLWSVVIGKGQVYFDVASHDSPVRYARPLVRGPGQVSLEPSARRHRQTAADARSRHSRTSASSISRAKA